MEMKYEESVFAISDYNPHLSMHVFDVARFSDFLNGRNLFSQYWEKFVSAMKRRLQCYADVKVSSIRDH